MREPSDKQRIVLDVGLGVGGLVDSDSWISSKTFDSSFVSRVAIILLNHVLELCSFALKPLFIFLLALVIATSIADG